MNNKQFNKEFKKLTEQVEGFLDMHSIPKIDPKDCTTEIHSSGAADLGDIMEVHCFYGEMKEFWGTIRENYKIVDYLTTQAAYFKQLRDFYVDKGMDKDAEEAHLIWWWLEDALHPKDPITLKKKKGKKKHA